jgi:hypothetical protein
MTGLPDYLDELDRLLLDQGEDWMLLTQLDGYLTGIAPVRFHRHRESTRSELQAARLPPPFLAMTAPPGADCRGD